MPVPQLTDETRRPATADDGCQRGAALRHLRRQRGQVPRQTRAADDGIRPRPKGGTNAVGILRGGHHGVDGY